MGVFSGLADINAIVNKSKGGGGSTFFRLKANEFAKVRFLQELDESSPHYNEKNGLGLLVLEHSDPDNFRNRSVCTKESEGRCWACEQRVVDDQWRPKGRLYINAFVRDKDGNESVQVVNQGLGPRNIVHSLIDAANEYGSITAYDWKIKRTGSGMSDTSYTLTLMPSADDLPDVTDYQLHDLSEVVRQIPFDQQAQYYRGGGEQKQANTDDGW